MGRVVNQASLWYYSGSSDKVYYVRLEQAGSNKYVVNVSYGKRGATLLNTTKTPRPVSYSTAYSIFNSLVTEKEGKGYDNIKHIPDPKEKEPPKLNRYDLRRKIETLGLDEALDEVDTKDIGVDTGSTSYYWGILRQYKKHLYDLIGL